MKFIVFIALALLASSSWAALVIHATEIGVGKFHRYDNKTHPYAPSNVWAPHITPDNADMSKTPIVFANKFDNSVTIQFSNLDELLKTVVAVSKQRGEKVDVLNINGHGMPGGMWYPKDAAQLKSDECSDWVAALQGPDKANYDEYYSPVSKEEIMDLRSTANYPAHYACVTGAPEWKEVVGNLGIDIKQYFNDGAQIHFESCLVGLGPVGEAFTETVASLLLPGTRGMVKTSLNFGLGDWSMPEGMGFWDYQNDDQLNHDNDVYPKDRSDREIMQKGTIRVAHVDSGRWSTSLVADQNFMLVGLNQPGFSNQGRLFRGYHTNFVKVALPLAVHIPGTNKRVRRLN
jgi:hypothetical protein